MLEDHSELPGDNILIGGDLDIPENYMQKWQNLANTIAELIDVPTGLIMRLVKEDIQVFVSSKGDDNPYTPGDSDLFNNSGLYCEHVLKKNKMLHIPNALKIKEWKNNPDVKLNMISYLGFPILLPNETPFGTICILDNREHEYSELHIKVLSSFKEIIENDLKTLFMNQTLGTQNRKLIEFISELHYLRGLLRICANCKKIHEEDGSWVEIETYIRKHSEAEFSHSLCEVCVEELYGDEPWFKNV